MLADFALHVQVLHPAPTISLFDSGRKRRRWLADQTRAAATNMSKRRRVIAVPRVQAKARQSVWAKRMGTMGIKLAVINLGGFQQILEQKQAELVQELRLRDDITIEKSSDPMDEIQYATERDLAIHSAGLENSLLRNVRAALVRIRDGSFGTCIECEAPISRKRLQAVPWASLCIKCQDTADADCRQITESPAETFAGAW